MDSDKAYGLKYQLFMVGQYLWVTTQAPLVMNEFLHSQFRNYPEVAPHITLYIFEHFLPRVEIVALRHKVDIQAKSIRQKENTCEKLMSRVNSLTDKVNHMGGVENMIRESE